jgi:hypothetical protein
LQSKDASVSAQKEKHAAILNRLFVMELNTLPRVPTNEELDADYSCDLRGLRQHLEREFSKARFAPSIISRSEAELLGISTPRFSIRLTLTDGGFVNCRRLKVFSRNARIADANTVDVRGHPREGFVRLDDIKPAEYCTPGELLREQSCIADCLLAPPMERRGSDYHYLTVTPELFQAYGELVPAVGAGNPWCSRPM